MTAAIHVNCMIRGEEYEMIWSDEAKEALTKVPFFVRKRVKRRVEDEVKGYQKDASLVDSVSVSAPRVVSRTGNPVIESRWAANWDGTQDLPPSCH
jgi:hypothetical protein